MNILSSIFKAYDIRGIYPQEINEDSIVTIVKAIYSFFVKDLKKENLSIVLGCDMRVSSPILFDKAQENLIEMGAKVIDVGLVSTPTFYFAVLDGNYDAGIQISASHNPKEYNGIKFVKREGDKLIKIGKTTGMTTIAKQVADNGPFYSTENRGKVTKKTDIVNKEVEVALQSIKPSITKNFKVVADPGNAMGALYIEELFKNLPCELIKINFELDGTFPAHQPDPLQFDTLKELQEKVLAEKADFGIAPDGDGDRVFFIDEKGNVVPATLISSLIAERVLADNPGGKVIVDIRYTRNVAAASRNAGGEISISKVGHALITQQLNEEGALFAGESSGHFYFKETGGAESSVRVMLYVLEAMSKQNLPLSELLKKYQSSYESGEFNFEVPSNVKTEDILNQFREKYSDGTVSTLDGLSIDFPDWRFNIRTSNTEPLLRLNLEADSQKILEKHKKELVDKITSTGASPK